MGTFTGYFVITDKNGRPLNKVDVELLEVIEFTPANPDPQEHIVAVGTTEESGEVTFGSLDETKRYYARPRVAHASVHVVVPTSTGGYGAPASCDFLVGTSQAGLSAEIIVGASPGGELGGSWASPTVDATHSGSAHHAQAHSVASHDDTTATGTELETLTDGSDADSLHDHSQFASAAQAIAAVEGEATLDLTGDVTIAGGKSLLVDVIDEKTGAAGVTIPHDLRVKGTGILRVGEDDTAIGYVLVYGGGSGVGGGVVRIYMSDDYDDVCNYWSLITNEDDLTFNFGTTIKAKLQPDGQFNTDTINELTGAAGVTIDTVLIKDGNVDGVDVSVLDSVAVKKAADFQLSIDSTPSDDTASGITAELTAGTNLVWGNFCYIGADGKMEKALATAEATSRVVAFCTETVNENAAGTFLLHGFIRDDSAYDFTLGAKIYLSDDTAGAHDETQPAGEDECIVILGVALTADCLYFNPSVQAIVEHVAP